MLLNQREVLVQTRFVHVLPMQNALYSQKSDRFGFATNTAKCHFKAWFRSNSINYATSCVATDRASSRIPEELIPCFWRGSRMKFWA